MTSGIVTNPWSQIGAPQGEALEGIAPVPERLTAMQVATLAQSVRNKPLVRVGQYTGIGVINTGITLDCVIVVPSGNVAAGFLHKYTWRGNAPNMGVAESHLANVVLNISGTTFETGVSAGAGGYWIALADNGSGELACGSYAGNGVDNRAISVGFAPIFVMVKRDNAFPCWILATGMSVSRPLTAAAANAGMIKSLTTTGFTVGTADDVNQLSDGAGTGGEAYDYVAFAPSLAWRVMQYLGTGAARSLQPVPDMLAAIVKSHDTSTPRLARIAVTGMPGDKVVANTAAVTGVTAIRNSQLQLTTSAEANAAGVVNTVLAFQPTPTDIEVVPTPQHTGLKIGEAGGVICVTNNPGLALLSPSPIGFELLFQYANNGAGTTYIAGRSESGSAGNLQYIVWYNDTNKSLLVTYSLGAGVAKAFEYGIVLPPKPLHLQLYFDGVSVINIYANGVLVKTADAPVAVGQNANPVNAKFSIGCRRNTGDTTANSTVGSIYSLVRLYNVVATPEQAYSRYRRAVFDDFSEPDLTPLEEWCAKNIVGTTWYATYDALNNGTIKGTADVVTQF